MRKCKYFAVFLLLLVMQAYNFSQTEDSARSIVEKSVNRYRGDTLRAEIKMVLIDRQLNKRERQAKILRQHMPLEDRFLVTFSYPPDLKGTKFLTYDTKDKSDSQWIYLSGLKKIKRISANSKSNNFLGTDFFYSDFIKIVPSEYHIKMLNDRYKLRNKITWMIELIPKHKSKGSELGYDKMIYFIDKDSYIIRAGVYWVYSSNQIKYYDVKEIKQVDGIFIPTEVHLSTTEQGNITHKTILVYDEIKINSKIDDDLDPNYLKHDHR